MSTCALSSFLTVDQTQLYDGSFCIAVSAVRPANARPDAIVNDTCFTLCRLGLKPTSANISQQGSPRMENKAGAEPHPALARRSALDNHIFLERLPEILSMIPRAGGIGL